MDSEAVAERTSSSSPGAAEALLDYPGTIPTTLNTAYAYQDRAIALWPDHVAGWKVGRIGPPWHRSVRGRTGHRPHVFSAPRGIRLAPPRRWSNSRCSRAASRPSRPNSCSGSGRMRNPTKCTGSARRGGGARLGLPRRDRGQRAVPLAAINELGPTVVVSDFGNNAGLLLGPAIPQWRRRPFESLTCETFIDDVCVGQGGAASLPGGPLAAVAFALGRCARRGLPMKAGYVISTGAATGIHEIRIGQTARVKFDGLAELLCRGSAGRQKRAHLIQTSAAPPPPVRWCSHADNFRRLEPTRVPRRRLPLTMNSVSSLRHAPRVIAVCCGFVCSASGKDDSTNVQVAC